MNDSQYKKTSLIFIVYIVLFAFSFIVISFSYFKVHNSEDKDNPQYIDYSSGWLDINENEVDLSYLNTSTKIFKNLGEIKEDCTLFFRAKNINVDVLIDGNMVKESQFDLNSVFGKTPGTYFISIPVSVEDSYKVISIDINNPYKNDSSCNIKDIYLGDIEKILLLEVKQKIFNFCMCMFICFLGVIFIIVSYFFRKYETDGNSLLYLGLFSFVIGLWSATETKFLQLVYGYSEFWHIITGTTLMLITIPIFLFFRKRYKESSNFSVYFVGIIAITSYLVSFALHFLNIYDFHETIILSHICLLVAICFTFFFSAKVAIVYKLNDYSFWGLIIIAMAALLDIVLYYLQITNDNSTFTRIGVIFYICLLSVQIMRDYVKIYNKGLRVEMLSKMAYIDLLTNCFNRASFIEDIKKMDLNKKENNNKIIAVFDVNNLKSINDTFGHSEGDAVIIEASELIKDTFEKYGKCYRIGGDEFVVISNENVDVMTFQALKNKMNEKINYRNKKEVKYTLQIAAGITIFNSFEEDVIEAFNRADEMMYLNKNKLKNLFRLKQKREAE